MRVPFVLSRQTDQAAVFPALQWDLLAGISVGFMIVPQGMSYATIAGELQLPEYNSDCVSKTTCVCATEAGVYPDTSTEHLPLAGICSETPSIRITGVVPCQVQMLYHVSERLSLHFVIGRTRLNSKYGIAGWSTCCTFGLNPS